MDSLQQLWPLVRPHRHALVVAIACAGLAASFWAVALLLAFPITKVLLQQQSLAEYVDAEIEKARSEMQERTAKLDLLDVQLTRFRSEKTDHGSDYVRVLRSRARTQEELGSAARREWWYELAQQHLIPALPVDRFDCLAVLLTGMLVVTGLHGATVYLQEIWIGRVVQLSMRSLRARLFRQTLQLDVQTLAIEGTPTLMSRFTNDLTAISQGMALLGGKIVLEPLKAGACIGSAFLLNWRLTLLSLLCAPIGALLFQRFGTKLKKASRRQMETVARLYGVLQETLSSYRVVTAFNQQRHHRRKLYYENREYYRKAMQINRLDALANPTVELLGVCAACLAILPGAYLVLRQKTDIFGIQLASLEMELASLALLYSLLAGVLDPARKLSSAFSRLKKAVAACERVMLWMDQHPAVAEPACTRPAERHRVSLEFDQVTYHYPSQQGGGSVPALNHVSLRIEFGEVVAIVGSNGSGKSTLAGLIPRFYDPQVGQVRIDGIDTATMSLRSLRAELGWVPQEPMLFDRSIADNIAVGAPHATPDQIEAVARQAFVWEFAAAWPEGLQTHIGDSGNRLSGGQRQRIALARALLRDPALLILDEATSAIDAQSEVLIHRALRDACRHRTTLIITHTLTPTLLEFVTRIVFLDRGRLIAVGRHEQLLSTCPPYAALYQAQSNRRAA